MTTKDIVPRYYNLTGRLFCGFTRGRYVTQGIPRSPNYSVWIVPGTEITED